MRPAGSASFATLLLALGPLLVPLLHCGGDDAPPVAAGPQPTAQPSASTTGTATATDTTSTPPPPPPPPPPPGEGCTQTAVAAPFDVDPLGPDTQIHAYGVPAKDGLWVVYNRPKEAGGKFDVYATKLGCDGAALIAPVRVSDSEDNEIDPAAVWDEASGKLLIVWSADMTGKDPNLETRTRLLSATGAPLDAVRSLTLSRKGAPLGGNVWMPSLAKAPAGYTLVGTWGHDEAPGFQAFAQALDDAGATVGDGEDLDLLPGSSQDAPAVAYQADGTRVTAHASVANDAPNSRGADIRVKVGDAPATTLVEEGGRATIAVGASGTWIAYQNGVTKVGSSVLAKRKGLLQPAVAAADVGAAVIAYTQAANKSPLRAFRLDDTVSFVAGVGTTGVEISSGAAAYALHFAHVGGDVFVVAYQEGAGQQIRAKARFVTLPR